MPTKSYSKTGSVCRVTFRLPAEVDAEQAALCGEFNDWDAEANPMNDGRMIGMRKPTALTSSAAMIRS
jgi:hypothetical protein